VAVRDLLWGCPLCRGAGTIRRAGRGERCGACGASFRRADGASIVATRDGAAQRRSAAEGRILGPERVRVRHTRRQDPLHWSGELLGWVEVYDKPRTGTMTLRHDGLHFRPLRDEAIHWTPRQITGIQPASSSLQLGLHDRMASIRFIDGSVRLWTRALSELLRDHYRQHGRDVLELQPCVRTCPVTRTVP
jgi:hypothetical protein